MSRQSINVTLDEQIIRALEAEAKTKGDNRSRVLEQRLRRDMALPLPAEATESLGEVQLALTRSDRAILEVLKMARPDPLTFEAVVEKSGLTEGIANKHLLDLERRGLAQKWSNAWESDVELWGPGSPSSTVDWLVTTYVSSPRTWRDAAHLVGGAANACDYIGRFDHDERRRIQALVLETAGLDHPRDLDPTRDRIRQFVENVEPAEIPDCSVPGEFFVYRPAPPVSPAKLGALRSRRSRSVAPPIPGGALH